jgi:ATP-dependent DNA helicase MPH1
VQLEFSIGMFHTILTEIAGNTTAQGKKSMSKGSANSLRNNFEFQRLMRDVEAEINSIRVGRAGKTKADKHPKMIKTLELVSLPKRPLFIADSPAASPFQSSSRR